MRGRLGALAVVGCLSFLVLAPSAGAANSADGFCTATGTITFLAPIGNTPRATAFTDHAAGHCSGSVNGVSGTNQPITLDASGSGLMGCSASTSTDRGVLTVTRGTRTTRDDVRIHYVAESHGGLTQLVSRVRGAVSGESIAHVNFLPYGSQTQIDQCNAGTLRTIKYDLESQTITPLVG
jgi:hypothetical protein